MVTINDRKYSIGEAVKYLKDNKTWGYVLEKWSESPPNNFPNRSFQWNTSGISTDNSIYKESFLMDDRLPTEQDYTKYEKYFKDSGGKDAVSFPNLNGDAIMVVPIPKNGGNFATLHTFNETATFLQKKELWKLVVKTIQKQLKVWPRVWVSVHGHGVPYLHIRVSSVPRHYFDKKLKKTRNSY